MRVSLVTLTIYPSASDGTGVELTVIVVAVFLTRVEGEGMDPGASGLYMTSSIYCNKLLTSYCKIVNNNLDTEVSDHYNCLLV